MSSAARNRASQTGTGPASASAPTDAAAKPSLTAAKSRGLPRDTDSRPSARAMSGVLRNAARIVAAAVGVSRIQLHASCRSAMAAGSVSGPPSQSASSLAPPAVNVRLMAANKVWLVLPSRARVISSDWRVAASISTRPASPTGTSADNRGVLPACVVRT